MRSISSALLDRAHHAQPAAQVDERRAWIFFPQLVVDLIGDRADQADLLRLQAALAHEIDHAIRRVGPGPAHVSDRRHDARHRIVIEKLHQNHRLFAVLHEQVGFAAARPVAEPIDVRSIAPAAIKKRRIDAFLFHQAVNRFVTPFELGVGECWIIGSLTHGNSSKKLPGAVKLHRTSLIGAQAGVIFLSLKLSRKQLTERCRAGTTGLDISPVACESSDRFCKEGERT